MSKKQLKRQAGITSKSVLATNEESKGRYINPRTDFGFKRIFGSESNKDLLIHFLNSVLDLDDKIVNLEYSNVEQRGRIKTERGAFFDLRCTTSKGEYIIVEMQNIPQEYFKDRALYYVSFPILKQGEKKKTWNFELKPVYSVNLLNFRLDEMDDTKEHQYIHKVQLVDVKTGSVFYKKLVFVYIELPDFDKEENELKTDEDRWLDLLKNIDRLDFLPDDMKRNRIFRKVSEQAELANLTPEELDLYDESLKIYRNMYTTKHILNDYTKVYNKKIAMLTKDFLHTFHM